MVVNLLLCSTVVYWSHDSVDKTIKKRFLDLTRYCSGKVLLLVSDMIIKIEWYDNQNYFNLFSMVQWLPKEFVFIFHDLWKLFSSFIEENITKIGYPPVPVGAFRYLSVPFGAFRCFDGPFVPLEVLLIKYYFTNLV